MASRARSRRRFKSSTSRLTLQRYDIGGHVLSRPPSTTLPTGWMPVAEIAWLFRRPALGSLPAAPRADRHTNCPGALTSSSTGLGQRFLDHRAAAAAPHGLGGSEDQTSG